MRTVFVIGAGANVEIGMPSGNELKTKISKMLDFRPKTINRMEGDRIINSTLKKYFLGTDSIIDSTEVRDIEKIAYSISHAMPLAISIDNYLDAHKDNSKITFCGKLAIVRAILDAEAGCSLLSIYSADLAKMRGDENINSWYPLLFQKITEGCTIDNLPERFDNISFIIFNYDRCFEFFMHTALMNFYHITNDEADEFVRNLHINHPYGIVGNVWDEDGSLAFGKTPNYEQLIDLVKNIKTFTESKEREANMKNSVQYLVERADRIIFLGFAYHEQNINLLFKNQGVQIDAVPLSESTVCYGTGYQISEDDLPKVQSLLMQASKRIKECFISDITCTQFFRDFWYRLSFKSA
jgi:hypothetical protein